jgi:hypothetical protein
MILCVLPQAEHLLADRGYDSNRLRADCSNVAC